MPAINPAAVEFLTTRRSVPAKALRAPLPDRAQVLALLTGAARSPDHGKLEPWRFIVLQGDALIRLANLAEQRGQALGLEPERVEKVAAQYRQAGLCVAVISSPKEALKIPQIEQVLSAGAVCLALVNMALASGWGAVWLTGWASHDRSFVTDGLGLEDSETVAGIIHIGTPTATPPERPRPDVAKLTTWMGA